MTVQDLLDMLEGFEPTTVALSTDEYEALTFAADMLAIRADDYDDCGLSALAAITRRQADHLRGLHDRWHQARTLAATGALHEACGYCGTKVAA